MRSDVKRNRARLIAAAREVFAEHGFETSMDVIATRAGVGVGTAYRHFANKYDLANAVFDDAVDAIVARAEQANTEADPFTALQKTLEQTLARQAGNRAIREMILADHQDDWTHHDALLRPVRTAVAHAKEAGTLRSDAQFSDVAAILIMLCMLTEQVAHTAPQLWRRYLPTMLAGLRAEATPLPGTPLTDEALRAAQVSGLLRYL